jgi:CRP-like cAMP-binding protein
MSIIVKGIAELYVSLGDYDLRAEYLRPGDMFNHNIFLLGIPVQVNIKCISDLEVLQLHTEKVTLLK